MKDLIVAEIERFTVQYQTENRTATTWARPIVGCADAGDPLFVVLRRVVSPTHLLPQDLLPTAKTVIAFFLPFEKKVAMSNIAGVLASKKWVLAYVETNGLIAALGKHMREFLDARNYQVKTTPATHNFDEQRLISNWSHRHIGYVAGLGNFGVNNMMITERGCCGRIGSFVTDLSVAADPRLNYATCLYRHDSSCLKCVDRCVNSALFKDRFDRRKCYEMCLRNEARFKKVGKADVCGKCLVGLPCSLTDPVRSIRLSTGL
jgi:epoxyqueuosine reductase QueG